MSKVIKLSLSDEYYDCLVKRAEEKDANIQDYIRSVLFPEEDSITPQMAIGIALATRCKGDKFTVPELFGDNWNLSNGYAGVFGRRFFNLVKDKYSDHIRFTGTFNDKGNSIYEVICDSDWILIRKLRK